MFSDFLNCNRSISYFVSYKYKFVYLIISKNGCSSILSSILHYEYPNIKFDNNKKIWHQININDYNFYHHGNLKSEKNKIIELYNKGFTVFTTIRNPFDRFISWINETYTNKYFYNIYSQKEYYSNYFDYNNVQTYFDNYETILNKDLHIIPQSIYIYI